MCRIFSVLSKVLEAKKVLRYVCVQTRELGVSRYPFPLHRCNRWYEVYRCKKVVLPTYERPRTLSSETFEATGRDLEHV